MFAIPPDGPAGRIACALAALICSTVVLLGTVGPVA